MRIQIKNSLLLLTGILVFFGARWVGCNPIRAGFERGNRQNESYSFDGTEFTPAVKWISDKVYRIYLQRNYRKDNDDYIELRLDKTKGDALGITKITYDESNPRDLYLWNNKEITLLNVNADYYNVYHIELEFQNNQISGGRVTSYGEKKLPRSVSSSEAFSLLFGMQYRWEFIDGTLEVGVYIDSVNFYIVGKQPKW